METLWGMKWGAAMHKLKQSQLENGVQVHPSQRILICMPFSKSPNIGTDTDY